MMTVWINHERTKGYAPVHKCASSTMLLLMQIKLGWQSTQEQPPSACVVMGIIRNPVDRWISGMGEHYSEAEADRIEREIKNKSLENLVSDNFKLETLGPQFVTYSAYPNVQLFRLEDWEAVLNWLGIEPCPHHKNNHKDSPTKRLIHELLREKMKGCNRS